MNSNNQNLKKTLDKKEEEKVKEVADKEREKIQAIDRLRD